MNCHSLNVQQTADLLREQQDILILSHQNPDGDTIGSAYALCLALQQLGKRAMVLCTDPVPRKMDFVTQGLLPELSLFSPEKAKFVVAVDIADTKLMGAALAAYQQPGTVQLCIDHHLSNQRYAQALLLGEKEAATCQILYRVLMAMGITLTKEIAQCLYLGIATDTGCFRYSNTQPETHRLAACLMETGIDWYHINFLMFEQKSKAQMELERRALQTLRLCCQDKACLIAITQQTLRQSGATLEDAEGITAVARNLEGVEIGATLKERPEGGFKVSVRTGRQVDASAICAVFGGGGHLRAGGCTLEGSLEQVQQRLIRQFALALGQSDEDGNNEER